MKIECFNKLLEDKEPKKIIYMHCNSDITLTNKQLKIVIEAKNKKEKRKIFISGRKYKLAENVDNVDNFVEKSLCKPLKSTKTR